jgi:hypothetical protein
MTNVKCEFCKKDADECLITQIKIGDRLEMIKECPEFNLKKKTLLTVTRIFDNKFKAMTEYDNFLLSCSFLLNTRILEKFHEVNPSKKESLRYNSGKLEMHTLPVLAFMESCKVGMVGAAKYEDNNWRKEAQTTQYLDSAMRHLVKYMYGEDLDPETKCSHLSHLVWNGLAALEKVLTNTEIDNRFKYDNKIDLEQVFNLNEDQKEIIEKFLEKKK